jgi:hypothetical protein
MLTAERERIRKRLEDTLSRWVWSDDPMPRYRIDLILACVGGGYEGLA